MKVKFQQFDRDFTTQSMFEEITDNRFIVLINWGKIDEMVYLTISHYSFSRYYHNIGNIFLPPDWSVEKKVVIDVNSGDGANDYQILITADSQEEHNYVELMKDCHQMMDRDNETDYVLFVPRDKFCKRDESSFDNIGK